MGKKTDAITELVLRAARQAEKEREALPEPELTRPMEYDPCLTHMAWLERYRPRRIQVIPVGYNFPQGLVPHLRKASSGLFKVVSDPR